MRKKIAIAAGGDSGEYEVSVNSARVVYENLDQSVYEPYIIMMKGRNWYCELNGRTYEIDKNDFSLRTEKDIIHFDGVFIAIHGTPGEDGKLQGYFEMIKMPYSTSNWITSALTFDKTFCKDLVAKWGVVVPKSIVIKKGADYDPGMPGSEIGIPCFVKPNKGGSSVGTTWVRKQEDLGPAIELSFREDDETLVEEYIQGTEITCGVMRIKDELFVLPITEIVSKTEFFDYEAKYTTGMADEITPARIDEATEIECKRLSAFLYNQLNCRGVCRFDYIFNQKAMYFLEVNTVPGLSANSIVPQQAENMGISLPEFFNMLIEDMLARQ